MSFVRRCASARGRSARGALTFAALAAILTGCGPVAGGSTPARDADGAVLTGVQAGSAGQQVVFDATGSELSGEKLCPDRLYFFVDDTDGVDGEVDDPPTLDSGQGCTVTNGKQTLTLPAGAPGTTHDQKVQVMVEGYDEAAGELVQSKAEMTVKVTTPGPKGTQPVVAQPTTATTSTTTPPTTGGGSGGGGGGGGTPTDTTAPETTIDDLQISGSTATFTFHSEAGATFECKLDGPGSLAGSYGACTSPQPYTLPDGDYTFYVRAKDAAGNVDASPASHFFTMGGTTSGCTPSHSPGVGDFPIPELLRQPVPARRDA